MLPSALSKPSLYTTSQQEHQVDYLDILLNLSFMLEQNTEAQAY